MTLVVMWLLMLMATLVGIATYVVGAHIVKSANDEDQMVRGMFVFVSLVLMYIATGSVLTGVYFYFKDL